MRFHHNKPLTILDVPTGMRHAALDLPDPETPVGARGVGEPPACFRQSPTPWATTFIAESRSRRTGS
jgi:hypothetical protein